MKLSVPVYMYIRVTGNNFNSLYDFSMGFWNCFDDLVLLFNANSTIVQLYYGESKLIFNEMMMRSSLY